MFHCSIASLLKNYINVYLQNRPAFFALIRPQEAVLFTQHVNMMSHPILDLGCGDGFFAQLVWGKGKIDVGLDLHNARTKKIENAGIYKKISYFDGVKIPYPDNFFQTIVSNCVLEHVEKLPELLKEVSRVLRPGGFFLTSVMCDKWDKYLLGRKIIGKKYIEWMRKKQDHHNLFSEKKWREVFKAAGFKIESETGYLSKSTSMWLDLFHYISASQLICNKLFGRWVLFPKLFLFSRVSKVFEKLIIYPKRKEESAALFFVLSKK